MILPYKDKFPVIGNNVFIAPTAVIIGDVIIGDYSSIWYGAVVRGDTNKIVIGDRTNIQDNCTLHVDLDAPLTIGSNVTVGHNAIVHGCILEDFTLVGINAVVLNNAVVRKGSVVAAGAVVGGEMLIGPCQLAAGVPATIKKQYPSDQVDHHAHEADIYVGLAKEHMKNITGPSPLP